MSKATHILRRFARKYVLVGGWILVVLVVLGLIVAHMRLEAQRDGSPIRPDVVLTPLRADDHVLGDRNAQVRVFVYTDLECPYCKRFHEAIPFYQSKYGEDIAMVYRHFPLAIHPKAYDEARAAECIAMQGGDDAFFRFVGRVFEESQTNDTFPSERLSQIAAEMGFDEKALDQCRENRLSADRVDRDVADGLATGFSVTPTVVVEGAGTNHLVSGNFSARIQAAIDALLQRAH